MKLIDILSTDPAEASVKYVVTLTDEERATLKQMTKTGTAAARTLQHAWILLKADAAPAGPGWTDDQIRTTFGVSLSTIVRVRRALVEVGMAAALHRRRITTPRRHKIDGEAEAHLVAVVCGPPPDGRNHWTMRLLADKYVELVGGEPVSHETIRRTLKKKRTQAVATGSVVHPR
jgi:hypothetical protein